MTYPHSSEEYPTSRPPSNKLLGGSHFAAGYSAEHVAGGEFVVGAAFAAWGASPSAVLMGLIIGNLLAVLSWAWVCSPVAVRARLTLYEYLSRMAGVGFVKVFNVVNGIIFAVIAGGMLTISAQALHVALGLPAQTNWYSDSPAFIGMVALVGMLVMMISTLGFHRLTTVARYLSPYLLTIFVVCGLASLPLLWQMGRAEGLGFWRIFEVYIWTGRTPDGKEPFSIWHIAAFAWGLNLPLHLGMGDMSTLRFAKKWQYGYHSAWATYGGHFVAWVGAGMLGATSALLMGVPIGNLDIGGVVVPVLGVAGVTAVVLASITTAVPSLYRATLAFDGVCRIGFVKMTVFLGTITTIIACFPLIFLRWLDLMAYFNIIMAPVGAMIAAEHFILPRVGIRPLWRVKNHINKSAIITWLAGLMLAAGLLMSGVHLFFVFVPVWLVCVALYAVCGYHEAKRYRQDASLGALYESSYGHDGITQQTRQIQSLSGKKTLSIILFAMLIACLPLYGDDPASMLGIFQLLLIVLTVLYFSVVVIINGWRLLR